MLRNKEIQLYVLSLISVWVLCTFGCMYIDEKVTIVVVASSSLLSMIVLSLLFTRWRYDKLAELSTYIHQVAAGNYELDVRNNVEGELSIVKNELYKITVALREQATLLTQDKQLLVDAISDISHQLKTPLTSMFVMTDLLSDELLPASKRMEFTNHLRSQLQRLQWLVTSLLKLAKMDAGAITFKRDEVVVQQLIEQAVEHLLIPLEIKEQTLLIHGHEQVKFVGDFHWSVEAVTNVVKNAIEHAPQGGTITIEYSENSLYTSIAIRDDGAGIAPSDLPYIFQRFYKGHNAHRDSIGIGLAMSRSIIEHQGGTIEVERGHHQGVQFLIKMYKSLW